MTELEYLKTDLDIHLQSREALKDGIGGFFLRREGHNINGIISTYDGIIKSLEEEIASLEGKKRSKKSKKH